MLSELDHATARAQGVSEASRAVTNSFFTTEDTKDTAVGSRGGRIPFVPEISLRALRGIVISIFGKLDDNSPDRNIA